MRGQLEHRIIMPETNDGNDNNNKCQYNNHRRPDGD